MERLLERRRIVRLAFHSDGRSYLLPLGYVWLERAIFVVSVEGTKTRMAEANSRVAFQVDDAEGGRLARWASVTGEGVWELVAEPEVRARVRDELLRRFPELADWGRSEFQAKGSEGRLLVARITPDWMTGRAFEPGSPP
jgi:uncharacterized protein